MLRLLYSHGIAGVLHIVSSTVLAVLSADYNGVRNIYLLRETWSPQGNHSDCSELKCVTAVETGDPYPFNLAAAAIFFGYWSGVMHLYAAWTVRDVSNDAVDGSPDLQFRLRRIRFFDYSITSSVMLACVSLILGSPDLGQLVSAVAAQFLVVATFYFGQRANAPWFAFCVSSIGYAVAWTPLFLVFQASTESSNAEPPEFVSFILLGVFFTFTSFAFIQAWLLWRPKTAYSLEEALFLRTSLTSKVLLHWTLFVAAISYSDLVSDSADGTESNDTSQDVLSVVIGTIFGGMVMALLVTYPAWRCWGPGSLTYR